jgi:acyl carrier protein
MRPSEIADTVRDVASRELHVAPEDIADRVESLDSIERMQLAVAVEDHFHIRLSAKDEARLFTMSDVVALIGEKLQASAAEGR